MCVDPSCCLLPFIVVVFAVAVDYVVAVVADVVVAVFFLFFLPFIS